MFEFIYSKKRVAGIYRIIRGGYAKNQNISPLLWTEHCVECAAPACYGTCPRYQKRADGNCVRLVGSFTPVKNAQGIGATCEFRTWAKIESQLKTRTMKAKGYGFLYCAITRWGYFFRALAAMMPFRSIQRFIDNGWFSYRQKWINLCIKDQEPIMALTLKGDVTNQDHPSTFLVDIKSASALLYRKAIEIPLGQSTFSVNIPPYESKDELYFINLHPVNAEEHVKVTFNSLEMLPTNIREGKKVKCVIWDLDNTLWDGVLIEGDVKPNQRLIDLIKKLDERGIVNSIVSKNNAEEVEAKLRELGISDYFVFKKVNWTPKSVNIANTIKQMNINPDTIVFVDDNPFERNEVLLHQPSITCVDPTEIEEIAQCSRFNAIVTEDSKKRRDTYKMLEAMATEEERWEGDINDFLKSCNIKAEASQPKQEEVARCYELLQRTNQLNSSGRRLSMEEVQRIVQSESYDSFVLRSNDKFGDYGIVGFLIINKEEEIPVVTDFVISCRVANKKIEPTLINNLAQRYGGKLLFNYKKTLRNGPMFAIINELCMTKQSSTDNTETYLCTFNADYPKIVDITLNR